MDGDTDIKIIEKQIILEDIDFCDPNLNFVVNVCLSIL